MVRQTIVCGSLLTLAGSFAIHPAQTQTSAARAAVLYKGARLISGDGQAPIEGSAFLVENGTVLRVGRKGELVASAGTARVDLAGKTVMPALINTHGHPGFQKGVVTENSVVCRQKSIAAGFVHLDSKNYREVEVLKSSGYLPGRKQVRYPKRHQALIRAQLERFWIYEEPLQAASCQSYR